MLIAFTASLRSLNPLHMDASLRSECMEGTRHDILNYLANLLIAPHIESTIVWLYGVAGSGKSAISTSLANRLHQMVIGVYLFFNRGDPLNSNPAGLIRTLAYKLAISHPVIQQAILGVLELNPAILSMSIRIHFQRLLHEPLWAISHLFTSPVVIILDALDECGDRQSRQEVLRLLSRQLSLLPPIFRFFITNRAEPDIVAAFNGQLHIDMLFLDPGTKSSCDDVALFIRESMDHVRREHHLPRDWPGLDRLQKLTFRSSGLFIWASTAIQVLCHGHNPHEELRYLLEGGSELDDLYATAIHVSGNWRRPSFVRDVRMVLGVIIVSQVVLTDETIDRLLGLSDERSSRFILSRLRSVLDWGGPGQPIRTMHASFADYITHQDRCGDRPWFIDPVAHHGNLAICCLTVLKAGLLFNICQLETSSLLNAEVANLPVRVQQLIPVHLQYACRFWVFHCTKLEIDQRILGLVWCFMSEQLLFWLEALILCNELAVVSPSMLSLRKWGQVRLSNGFWDNTFNKY